MIPSRSVMGRTTTTSSRKPILTALIVAAFVVSFIGNSILFHLHHSSTGGELLHEDAGLLPPNHLDYKAGSTRGKQVLTQKRSNSTLPKIYWISSVQEHSRTFEKSIRSLGYRSDDYSRVSAVTEQQVIEWMKAGKLVLKNNVSLVASLPSNRIR